MSVNLPKSLSSRLNSDNLYVIKLFLSEAVFETSVGGLIVVLWLLKLAYQCFTNLICGHFPSISVSRFSFEKFLMITCECMVMCFTHHLMYWISFVCRGWLERESRYGLQPGHNWFIISMQWWQQWKEYVKYVSKIPIYLHLK